MLLHITQILLEPWHVLWFGYILRPLNCNHKTLTINFRTCTGVVSVNQNTEYPIFISLVVHKPAKEKRLVTTEYMH